MRNNIYSLMRTLRLSKHTSAKHFFLVLFASLLSRYADDESARAPIENKHIKRHT